MAAIKPIFLGQQAVEGGKAYELTVSDGRSAAPPTYAAVLVDWLKTETDQRPFFQTYLLPGEQGWSGLRVAPGEAGYLRANLYIWPQWTGEVTARAWRLRVNPAADAPQPRRSKFAVADQSLARPSSLEGNLAICLETIRRAGREGVELLCLSENFLDRDVPLPREQKSMGLDDPPMRALCAAAREAKLYLTFAFAEKTPEGRLHTSAPLIAPDGRILGVYRKNYLTQGELQNGVTPGEGFPVFATPLGRIGILICYDMWYAETAVALAKNGAEILCHPLAGDMLPPHWDHCWRARALDHQMYVLTSITHNCDGVAPSRIIAPDGKVLAETRLPNALATASVQVPWEQELLWFSAGPWLSIVRNVMEATRAMHGRDGRSLSPWQQ